MSEARRLQAEKGVDESASQPVRGYADGEIAVAAVFVPDGSELRQDRDRSEQNQWPDRRVRQCDVAQHRSIQEVLHREN